VIERSAQDLPDIYAAKIGQQKPSAQKVKASCELEPNKQKHILARHDVNDLPCQSECNGFLTILRKSILRRLSLPFSPGREIARSDGKSDTRMSSH